MVKTSEERVARHVNVILNWFEELERLAPANWKVWYHLGTQNQERE
jgi:hypothetical protein